MFIHQLKLYESVLFNFIKTENTQFLNFLKKGENSTES